LTWTCKSVSKCTLLPIPFRTDSFENRVLVEGTRPREKLQVLLDDPFRTSTTLATVLPPQQQQPQLPSSSSSTALSTIANGVSTGNGMARGVADVSARCACATTECCLG